jgi:hypothetical protein
VSATAATFTHGRETEMSNHDHVGAWWLIGIVLVGIFLFAYITFFVQMHQFDVIYDRVGDIQRQLECPPGETFVVDHEGEEYCVDVAQRD